MDKLPKRIEQLISSQLPEGIAGLLVQDQSLTEIVREAIKETLDDSRSIFAIPTDSCFQQPTDSACAFSPSQAQWPPLMTSPQAYSSLLDDNVPLQHDDFVTRSVDQTPSESSAGYRQPIAPQWPTEGDDDNAVKEIDPYDFLGLEMDQYFATVREPLLLRPVANMDSHPVVLSNISRPNGMSTQAETHDSLKDGRTDAQSALEIPK